ncbi:hypothetical protein G6F55_011451 [Rhizopus delemar]|uniref:tRNA-binding domain-containing protein n=2 Tax=Rhizopus TaxID=4842 RepID=A0A9P7CJD4_9FUNG|nr:hypothetical protein G6F55_011451 [Rhizopus delemar]KAG1513604.1 hypothetical protein G6F52_010123 [Rhizopus delemar]KAG1534777.1 hypothetical protein G6F51_011904 [Rhizopus arrhizus]KAG1563663.1 hypothetical protein G6F50_011784 [Rhizopus delemar]KAG1619386.1 hypothetical protein G6F45_011744 [Rhizopus arrhizus]
MAATLAIPEKSSHEIRLVYKFLKSNIQFTTGKELSLEVSGEKIDTPNAIVKYLVSQANKPELLGNNAVEQAQVEEWLSFATQGLRNAGKKEIISNIEKKFNEHLSTRTFFVGNHLTIVDIVVFGILHSYTKNLKATTCPNVLRWFDLVQHMVIKANDLTEEFPLFEVNLDDVPEPVVVKEEKKSDKKGDKKEDKKADKKAEKKPADDNKKTEGGDKPKKEKKKAEKKPAAPAPAETDQPVVSRIDIRVGYIKSCKKHEGADSLYVEEIDVGEEEPRTIVSGLVRWYPIEQMENRYVLVLCNLKPASMRGIKSFGMVLCATAPDGSAVELLGPVDTSKVKPGDRVFIEGQEGEPEKVLNPKKKYWETVQPELKTNDDLIAHYGDKPLLIKTASGEAIQCKVATVKNGGIK